MTALRSQSCTPKGQRVLLGTGTASCYITNMRDGDPMQEPWGDKDGDRQKPLEREWSGGGVGRPGSHGDHTAGTVRPRAGRGAGGQGTAWLASHKRTVVAPDRARGGWVPAPSMSTSAKHRRIPGRSMPWHPEWSTLVYPGFLCPGSNHATFQYVLCSLKVHRFNNKGINYSTNYPITNMINKPIIQLSNYPIIQSNFQLSTY